MLLGLLHICHFTVDINVSFYLVCFQPLGSLEPLQCKEFDEAPRLVMSADPIDLRQCFLVDSKRLELQPPVTTQRAVALLMAAYFVLHVEYPNPYHENFLTVLDMGNGQTLQKLLRGCFTNSSATWNTYPQTPALLENKLLLICDFLCDLVTCCQITFTLR